MCLLLRVSRERDGKELAEIGQLVEAAAVAFSDDGSPVYDAELMRRLSSIAECLINQFWLMKKSSSFLTVA